MRILHNKTALIKAVERLSDKGSFAVTIGELALIADDRNLERLVNAFPEYFTEGRANLKVIQGGRLHYLFEGQTRWDSRG
jgi:hypothetical protein